MDQESGWSVIEQERRWLADLLESRDTRDWDRPSLCAGWRIRDVAAHVALASTPPSLGQMLVDGARARGRFHRLNHDVAVRHADRLGSGLVTGLREHADSRRLPAVTSYRNTLFDVLVHTQDVALPLGLDHRMPVEAARDAAQRVWTMGWPFWARRRLRLFRLAATDIDWTAGDGALVRGPIAALLLLLTGRTARLDSISGAGADRLRQQVNA
jgi:uncharacterized protein (TIGR03083 family)